MKKTVSNYIMLLGIVGLSLLMSCVEDVEDIVGLPPIANAGGDLTTSVNSPVLLDGTSSSDPDGDQFSLSWEVTTAPSGAQFSLTNSTAAIALFSAETVGNYVVTLTVNDGSNSATDDAVITVNETIGSAPVPFIVDENGLAISETNQNNEISAGVAFTLSGSQSYDLDGDLLTFAWEVFSSPDGATPTIDDASLQEISFTPDLVGEYIIQLYVSDGNGNTAMAAVTLTVANNPVIIDSNITEVTTWENVYDDPGLPDYHVTRSINVESFLTIDAGVKVVFDENVELYVTSTGGLSVEGIASDSVVMTSSNIAAGLKWKGIYLISLDARNSVNYLTLTQAGSANFNFTGTDYPAGIGVNAGGRISVNNSTFSENLGYALYIDDDGGIIDNFSNNAFDNNATAIGLLSDEVDALDNATTFTDNSVADVELFASTYESTNSTMWPALNGGASYFVSGNINIAGDLVIAEGANFEMAENVFWEVTGSLDVVGTASNHVVFTTANAAAQLHWGGIIINSASALNSFDYAELLEAGNSDINFVGNDFSAALGVMGGKEVSVTNTLISGSKEYGIYVDDDGARLGDFESNSFTDNLIGVGVPADEVDAIDGASTFSNNPEADVEVFGTTLSTSKTVTWVSLNNDASYRITGNLRINGDLTIAPGASFEIDENLYIWVNEGSLAAIGTASDRVVFTSSNISSGLKWQGFYIGSASALNEFDFVEVSHAGNSPHNLTGTDYAANIAVNTGENLTITNSIISNSAAYGVYSIGSTNDIEAAGAGNTFTNNPDGNVY